MNIYRNILKKINEKNLKAQGSALIKLGKSTDMIQTFQPEVFY